MFITPGHREDEMKRKKRLIINNKVCPVEHEKGMGLIVVIMVLAFLQIIGFTLLMVTGTGTKVAGNVRTQQMAYNAAEAGFDVAWTEIEEAIANSEWAGFAGHYLNEPVGIDDPASDGYFRKLSDEELLALIDPEEDGSPNLSYVVFCRQPYIQVGAGFKTTHTYTVFLIDDEAGSGTPDPSDCLMVCIGCVSTGSTNTTTRIEIELAFQIGGST
jgi:hypothetical protein